MKSGRIVTAYNSQAGFYPYDIEYSMKNRAADNNRFYYLRGTTTYTDTKKSVLSMWVKRSTPRSAYEFPWSWYYSSAYYGYVGFSTTEKLRMVHVQNSTVVWDAVTTPIHRDTSQWMHIYFKLDSTVPEMSIVVNGIPVTEWDTYSAPSLNYATCSFCSYTNWYNLICSYTLGDYHFDGYLADIHCFDGVTPPYTEFGEFKYNTWVPKEFTNTDTYPYGVAGLRFDFSDSEDLMKDTSGNEIGPWTSTGPPVQSTDTPTNNFPILDSTSVIGTISRAGLWHIAGAAIQGAIGTNEIPQSGKWYFEGYLVAGDGVFIGIAGEGVSLSSTVSTNTLIVSIAQYDDAIYNAGVTEDSTVNFTGETVGILVDTDNWEITFILTVSETDYSYGPYTIGISEGTPLFPYVGSYSDTTGINFGAEGFHYTIPIGYKTLCAQNWPTSQVPVINGENGFFVQTRTGDDENTITISEISFDMSNSSWGWIKNRDTTNHHISNDSLRNDGEMLYPSLNYAETSPVTTSNGGIYSFSADSINLVEGTSDYTNVNDTGAGYVDWIFNMIPKYGMDIIEYTGNATGGHEIPHNLGVPPEMIIIKNLDSLQNWVVGHKDMGGWNYSMRLNLLNSRFDNVVIFNSTEPDASNFTLGSHDTVNENNAQHIAYLFRSVPGFLKVGSYVGNGSTNGPRVYIGFRPRYTLIKNISDDNSWLIFDSARDTYNVVEKYVLSNDVQAETTNAAYTFDYLSNGWKIRNTGSAFNANGNTYIYLAIADMPYPYCNTF